MGPIFKFLNSLRSLAKSKNITIEEAYKFAQQEFGEVSDLLKLQINKIFKDVEAPSIKKPSKKEGEVIEAVFQPGVDKKGKRVEESESQLMQRLEEGIKTLKVPQNLTTGLTRTLAREILMKRGIDLGKGMDPIEIFRSKFGEEILGDVANLADELIEMEAMGKTPRRLEEILQQEGMFDIKMPKEPPRGYTNEELAEIQKEIDREDILLKFDPKDREPNAKGGRVGYEDGGLGSLPRGLRMDTTTFNPIPEDAPKMAADEIAKVIMGTLGNDEDMTSRTFIFENYVMPKRKDLMENYGLTLEEADNLIRQEMEKYRTKKATGGRVGLALGSLPKGIISLVKLINKKFGKGTVKTADEMERPKSAKEKEMFEEFETRNPDPKRQLTDDEIEELSYDVGDLDAYEFDGTVESANRIRKQYKDYMDDMYQQYKMGKLDPEPGDKSEARKIFLEKKLEDMEMSGDKRLMTRDEIEELSTFDLGTQMEEFKNTKSRLQKKYKGIIDDDLLSKMMVDDNPQRLAEVEAAIDQALELMKKGKSSNEVLDIMKQMTDRTKQAGGGLSYLSGF